MQKAHSNQLNLEWITNPALEKLVKSLGKSKKINLFNPNLKLESTQKDRNRYQLWLFFTKISFKQLHEERFEYFQVSNS